jgi:hypothetical protein
LPEDFDRMGADYATLKNYLLEKHRVRGKKYLPLVGVYRNVASWLTL